MKPEIDPRVMELIHAMDPLDTPDDQKTLAEQIGKLLDAAQKKVQEKKPDQAKVQAAYDAFFAATVSSQEANQKAEEDKKKADDILAKAYQAAATASAETSAYLLLAIDLK